MEESNTAALMQRDNQHLFHSLHSEAGHISGNLWERGEGSYLYNADGEQFIDGLSGLWCVALGHGRRELIEASSEQMAKLAYCSGYSGSSNRAALELGERLASMTYPSINRFFLTSGGGESTDSTIKTARYFWKAQGKPSKVKVISLQEGYHGVTMAAMCATGISSYWPVFEPRMPGFSHIPSHNRYRYQVPEGGDPATAAADELEQAILREGADSVAVFLAEPVQGSGGVFIPPDGYFKRIREICDKYDVLLAVDEVITGFGRTGTLFGLEHWGVEPDIMQFAKGITSGYAPLGGIGISDRINDVFKAQDGPTWMHAYTYSGHPVSCAIALAATEIIQAENLPARAAQSGQRLRANLQKGLGDHPHVGDIRGLGLINAVELVNNRETKQRFAADDKKALQVIDACRRGGLITRGRSDAQCNVIYLGPPLTTADNTIDDIANIVTEAVKSVFE